VLKQVLAPLRNCARHTLPDQTTIRKFMSKPTVYLTGAGPGDYKLLTLKALELIKRADCIIYDYLVNPELLKFAPRNCRLIYVGKKAGAHTLSQGKINQLLVKQARGHNTVVRLKGGDPFIFGRGAEEALYLKKKGINFEVVPGVTSAIAVPAYAGIPLSERSRSSTLGFITGNEDPTKKESNIDWNALVKALGTMVFLMGIGRLSKITKKLIAAGKPKSTPVAIIRQGTTSQQKTIIGNLAARNLYRMTPIAHTFKKSLTLYNDIITFKSPYCSNIDLFALNRSFWIASDFSSSEGSSDLYLS